MSKGVSQLGGAVNRRLFNMVRPDKVTNKVRQPTTPPPGTWQAKVATGSDKFEK